MIEQQALPKAADWWQIVRVVRRGWRRVLVAALCGALLGSAAMFVLHGQARATTTVFVTPLNAAPYSSDPRGQTLVDLITEAEVVKSDEVLFRAAARLENRISSTAIETATRVTIPAGSQVLAITFTQVDGVPANEGSDAVAQSYLDVRHENAQDAIDRQLTVIAQAEKAAKAQMREAARVLSRTGSESSSHHVAQRQLSVAAGTLATLANQRSTLITTPTSPGQILSPGRPSQRRLPISGAVFGFLTGALVGAVWSVYRDVRRRTDTDGSSEETPPLREEIPPDGLNARIEELGDRSEFQTSPDPDSDSPTRSPA